MDVKLFTVSGDGQKWPSYSFPWDSLFVSLLARKLTLIDVRPLVRGVKVSILIVKLPIYHTTNNTLQEKSL